MRNPVVRRRVELTRIRAATKRDAETVRACKELLKQVRAEEIDHKRLLYLPDVGRFDLDGAGPVGRAILLLYCANLFSTQVERRKCMPSDGQLFDRLLNAATRLRSLDLSPLDDPPVIDALMRVCSTCYFIKEDVAVASRVMRRLTRLNKVCSGSSEPWTRLCDALQRIYHGAPFIHYRPRLNKLEFDKVQPVKYSLQLDPLELLRCLETSPLLDKLVTERPSKSLLPHAEAVVLCIEHAVMWLNASHVKVFHPLNITYEDLTSTSLSENDHLTFVKFWDVRIPSILERKIRCSVFYFHEPHCFGAGGELYFLKPEEYEHALKYMLLCLRDDLSEKQIQVFRTLQFPYRCEPEKREYERSSTSGMHGEECKELMSLEPPQYRHLYI